MVYTVITVVLQKRSLGETVTHESTRCKQEVRRPL